MDYDYVIYHAHCLDGITAAAAAYSYCNWQMLSYQFIPMNAGKLPEEMLHQKNKSLLFLDVCPSLKDYLYMLSNGCHIFIIDHHKTALEELNDYKEKHIFDMNHSGAYLAWDYFYPDLNLRYSEDGDDSDLGEEEDDVKQEDKDLEKFILLIEDRDLFTNKYPETKFLFNGLCHLLNDIKDSNSKILLMSGYVNNYADIIKKGSEIEEENNLYVENIFKSGYTSEYKGLKCYVMETKNFNCISDIGARAYQDPEIDFTVVFFPNRISRLILGWNPSWIISWIPSWVSRWIPSCWTQKNDFYQVSLRSNKNGKNTDVSLIAKEFGGGGHRNAAGCTMKNNPTLVFK